MIEELTPVTGCWVRRRGTNGPAGRIIKNRQNGLGLEVKVAWPKSTHAWHVPGDLEAAFKAGWTVQDVPASTTRRSRGLGQIVGQRTLGERQQLLVQLHDDGQSIWLPYENLRRVKDVRMRFERAETKVNDHATRCRLRLMAHALENWNHLTGALDRLDVDPLPHQIQLVHRILSSGNYNWLIADDVGLGKTIEVGLLLAALKRKGQARRVLIVTPSGLVTQWQNEMKYKFDQDYLIYGRDIFVKRPEQWKVYDHVIVSIDLAKRENHMETIRQAGGWDIVIFDEAHKLTRYASGERADRFKLAEMLRLLTDALVLLSGTPHQGYADRFTALLELVRPDLKQKIHTLEANPHIVREMILRNRKSYVTDADGEFIFHGQIIHRVPVELSEDMVRFQNLLTEYLKKGYKAGEGIGAPGRAIGFVMTTYRKLASSSIAAIDRALRRRLERVTGQSEEYEDDQFTLEDLAEGGDDQDNIVTSISSSSRAEFFEFEVDMIKNLLDLAHDVHRNDLKLEAFLRQVVEPLTSDGKKLLIFTEYRGTQAYLKNALEEHFAKAGDVVLINGSMKLDEKLEAIDAFNGPATFMISTEAGGEGINLHRACHVMVNYDLPWNPARLVQRIGRLYRYGQEKTVVVFNLHTRDSFDNDAISLMLDRVQQMARDMAPVGTEFNDRLYAEILGDVLEQVDLASILQQATDLKIERTKDQIDAALERARQTKDLQDEIFNHVAGYDPNALSGTIGFTTQHVAHFVRNMLPMLAIDIISNLHQGEVMEVRLPDDMRGQYPEFGQRAVVRVTTERRRAQVLRDVVLLDFESLFFQDLIEHAKAQSFDGLFAATVTPLEGQRVLAAFKLRWQNDQGDPLTEEFVSLVLDDNGTIHKNPPFLVQWLLDTSQSCQPEETGPDERIESFNQLEAYASRLLGQGSSRFKHPNSLVQLAATDLIEVSNG
jgi:ERCC4-related helicase